MKVDGVVQDNADYGSTVQTLIDIQTELKSQYKQTEDAANQLKTLLDGFRSNLENVENLTSCCFNLPVIYAITPTYQRPVQKAELTRLSHTFRLIPNFYWIIVEDNQSPTNLIANLLKNSKLNYTHLVAPTPTSWKRKLKEPKWKKPRGVAQRNTALKWLRENRNRSSDCGVIYFADDDNTYDLQLFNEMRFIKKVGVWPVGLVGGLMVERPIIDAASGKVIGWNSHWRPERDFPIDMAGFAVNLPFLLSKPEAEFSFNVERGFQESSLLSQLVALDELEPRANNCTKVYVWHTRTEEANLNDEKALRRQGKRSDENIEV
ncbi:hypothetical protein V9T40_004315 [Parthenolecanium corni]|uniref:Galactosylgalactosylxylosylprotein 3-beta-glucuronosyltransferase n=1 Tax=Parthenolecanium corni TaxID=536013 RepID=A0AAN9TSE9_9HEMI